MDDTFSYRHFSLFSVEMPTAYFDKLCGGIRIDDIITTFGMFSFQLERARRREKNRWSVSTLLTPSSLAAMPTFFSKTLLYISMYLYSSTAWSQLYQEISHFFFLSGDCHLFPFLSYIKRGMNVGSTRIPFWRKSNIERKRKEKKRSFASFTIPRWPTSFLMSGYESFQIGIPPLNRLVKYSTWTVPLIFKPYLFSLWVFKILLASQEITWWLE